MRTPLDLAGHLAIAAVDLRHAPEADVIKALTLLRTVDASLFDWLADVLRAARTAPPSARPHAHT